MRAQCGMGFAGLTFSVVRALRDRCKWQDGQLNGLVMLSHVIRSFRSYLSSCPYMANLARQRGVIPFPHTPPLPTSISAPPSLRVPSPKAKRAKGRPKLSCHNSTRSHKKARVAFCSCQLCQ